MKKESPWGTREAIRLQEGLLAIGLDCSPGQFAQLEEFARLLLKWNRTYNLLGATSTEALIEDHLLDALATVPVLQEWLVKQAVDARCTLLDIGSGAGLPGLVVAILMPDVQVTLIEPNGKKTAFLRQAIAQCRLTCAHAVETRIEDLDRVQIGQMSSHPADPSEKDGKAVAGAVPHFICRAFTSLERFADLCAPHALPGSLLFAMKAARVEQELTELSRAHEVLAVEPLCTSYSSGRQRNLVVIRPARSGATTGTSSVRASGQPSVSADGCAAPSTTTKSETSLH